MQKDISEMTKRIRTDFAEFLERHPGESSSEVTFVIQHIEDRHMAAAIWMEKMYGMAIDADNLYDTVSRYDKVEKLCAELGAHGNVLNGDAPSLPPGKFNPAHLASYFMSVA